VISWATTSAFLLLLPLVAILALRLWNEKKARPTLTFSSLQFVKALRPTLRTRLKWLPILFYVASLVLVVMALARPQRADTKVKKNIEGMDIILTLDISDSMAIEDMPPQKNRIEAAQVVLRDFVKNRPNDRIGYVVFMGEAYTRVPLTLDHGLLMKSIEETYPSRNIKMGTAIGSALATAVGRLKDSTAKSRVIIFATDGESNSGTIDPDTALEIAKGFGMKQPTSLVGRSHIISRFIAQSITNSSSAWLIKRVANIFAPPAVMHLIMFLRKSINLKKPRLTSINTRNTPNFFHRI
jgi:Ca-activated chloride channel family protein